MCLPYYGEQETQGHDIGYPENEKTYYSVGPLALPTCPANGGLEVR